MNHRLLKISTTLAIITFISLGLVYTTSAVSYADGTLLKSPQHTSIYEIQNGKRHPFPSDTVYYTWYPNFKNVINISDDEMETIKLGNPIQIKPNTKLLKFPLNPRIYAVSENATIKHIPDPTTATGLFGDNWENKIIELPELFYLFYTEGPGLEPIAKKETSIATDWYKQYSYNGPPVTGDAKYWSTILATTHDDHFILAGSDGSYLNRQGTITKIDPQNGNTVFQKKFGPTNEYQVFTAIAQLQDTKGYIAAGARVTGASKAESSYSIRVVKTDESGNQLWSKTYNNKQTVSAITLDGTNGYVLAGAYFDIATQLYKGYVMKLDTAGTIVWEHTLADDTENPTITSLHRTSNGGYLISGTRENTTDNQSYGWLLKLDAQGNTVWEKMVQSNTSFMISYAYEMSDGTIVALSNETAQHPVQLENQSTTYIYYPHLRKFDANGNMTWEKSYTENVFKSSDSVGLYGSALSPDDFVSNPISYYAEMISPMSDGNIMITGTETTNLSIANKTKKPWVRIIDEAGNQIKNKIFTGSTNEYGLWGEQYKDKKIIIYGRQMNEKNNFVRLFSL